MPPVGRPRVRTGIAARPPVTEIGVAEPLNYGVSMNPQTGAVAPWRQWIDYVEYVPEMRWPQSVYLYDQMRTDSQLAALLTAVMYGIQQLRFIIDPNGADPQLVKEISQDLNLTVKGEDDQPTGRMKRRFSHREFVSQAMLAVLYGHMYFEQNGEIVDGKWRLRKLAARMPRTIQRINVADDGGLVSIVQWFGTNTPIPGIAPEIPVDNLCAFIFQQEGYNWVGRSMMRDCYKDWLLKDQLIRIEAVNHERAGGVPWATAPLGASLDEISDLDTMMRQFRIGDNAGGALPFGSKLEIAKGTGSDIDKTIQRYDESMARRFMLMLANLAQGGDHVGSYALADTFEDFFLVGQRQIAQWYCDTVNKHVIEDIVDWNYGLSADIQVPKLTWERTSEDSLGVEQLGLLVQRGIIIVDDEIENAVRYKYQFPKRTGPRGDLIVTPGGPRQPTQEMFDANPDLATNKPPDPQVAGAPSPAPSKPAPAKPQVKTKASWRVLPRRRSKQLVRWSGEDPDVLASAGVSVTSIKDIELLHAGIEYMLATGPTTFTPEDLVDVVRAANEDASIPQPRLGIGHIDPRYNDITMYDGTPTFGKATNLRLSDNGMAVRGDYEGVPEWLAEVMPYAFPSRSIEGFWNVESQMGNKYRFVLSSCKVLGLQWPGCSVIEDLPQYFGKTIPDGVIVDPALVAAMTGEGEGVRLFKKGATAASANLDDVRRAFYEDWRPTQSDRQDWWVTAVVIDPNELFVEDEATKVLYRAAIESDDKGVITFGEFAPIEFPSHIPASREAYAAAAGHVAAMLVIGRNVLASWPSREDSEIPPTSNKEGAMDPKEIRKQLGLAEDASDADVHAALVSKAFPTVATTTEVTAPATLTLVPTPIVEAPAATEVTAPVIPAAVAASVPAGMVLVDEQTLKAIQENSSVAASFVQKQQEREQDNLVTAAMSDGRIAPASKDHWRNMLKSDPNAAAVLAALTPGLVPVEMRGHGGGGAEGATSAEDGLTEEVVSNWAAGLFPEVAANQRRDAAMASGTFVPHNRVSADAKYRRGV